MTWARVSIPQEKKNCGMALSSVLIIFARDLLNSKIFFNSAECLPPSATAGFDSQPSCHTSGVGEGVDSNLKL